MKVKKWVYYKKTKTELIDRLSKELNINKYLAEILILRGIKNFQQAKEFFRPTLHMLHDPFQMLDMDKAVSILSDAIFRKKKVLLYGDYDVDGTTSVSLLYLFLTKYSTNIEYYIPDRFTEGYGISDKGMAYAIEHGFELIISLDCGINAVSQVKKARSHQIDFIICDHHLPKNEKPNAQAILNPKQKGCTYPSKELSGCGIGFKFLEGYCLQNNIDREEIFAYLDLVAVSIASDLVPMVNENRVLAYYGLKILNENPSPGLKSLIKLSKIKLPCTISNIIFQIGPRINAAGRLTHAHKSVQLLIGKIDEADEFAKTLNNLNTERKAYDEKITKEALDQIKVIEPSKKSIVLYSSQWHKGIIGIVASRCIEQYYKPTIIFSVEDQIATGSARSVEGFDIYEALLACEDLLQSFGGHKYAAGIKISMNNMDAFIQRFEKAVTNRITSEQLVQKVPIDVEIPLSILSFSMLKIITQMAPFGPENMAPIFATKKVKFKGNPRVLKEKHLKGFVTQINDNPSFEIIGFNLAHKLVGIDYIEQTFDIAYHVELNEYRGNSSLSLNLRDIRCHTSDIE